jgi:hypothetical protein
LLVKGWIRHPKWKAAPKRAPPNFLLCYRYSAVNVRVPVGEVDTLSPIVAVAVIVTETSVETEITVSTPDDEIVAAVESLVLHVT